ncbi:hypothetical protein HALO59_50925 [Halomonas sp. 59]|jgi:hypothetical protein|nr:hypothetical protein HALO113_80928 [Halomonas sp. 113]CAD5292084.1 hypothetical protein HALO59_50925 [Halomonas sp. 59]VXC57118.1 hypothetical protein HALO98_70530 [Halomonas titanicae]
MNGAIKKRTFSLSLQAEDDKFYVIDCMNLLKQTTQVC